MSATDEPDPHRETLDRLLDVLVFLPLRLLAGPDRLGEELAARGRRHLEAARLLGRMALGHPPGRASTHPDSEQTPNPEPG